MKKTSLMFALLLFIFPATLFAKTPITTCDPPALPNAEKAPWRKSRSKLLTKVARARHFARDVVSVGDSKVMFSAKFTYGSASKDLEGEDVEVFISKCGDTSLLGTGRTTDDGWIDLPGTLPSKPGRYDVVFRVKGDRSTVKANAFVLPAGAKIAVFDIDGTLTTSDNEVIEEVGRDYYRRIGKGSHDPQKYPYAVELVKAYVAKGYTPVYLSGRPYWLMSHSRDWLSQHKFPTGPLLVTRRHRDVAPNIKGVGQFKLRQLNRLAKHFNLAFAHGNAETDIYAYLGAGIPKDHVYIIGANAGKSGTRAVKESWGPRVKSLTGASKEAR